MLRPLNTEKEIPFGSCLYEVSWIGLKLEALLRANDGVGAWTGEGSAGAIDVQREGRAISIAAAR